MADDDSFDLSGDLDDFLNEDSSSALDLGTDLSSDDLGLSGIDSVESEELAPLESSADFGADLVEDVDDQIEETAAGAGVATASAVVAPKRRGMLSSFSIFDAMLVFSLILVTAAALMMAYGLNDYGSVFGLPWKTTGITVK